MRLTPAVRRDWLVEYHAIAASIAMRAPLGGLELAKHKDRRDKNVAAERCWGEIPENLNESVLGEHRH